MNKNNCHTHTHKLLYGAIMQIRNTFLKVSVTTNSLKMKMKIELIRLQHNDDKLDFNGLTLHLTAKSKILNNAHLIAAKKSLNTGQAKASRWPTAEHKQKRIHK